VASDNVTVMDKSDKTFYSFPNEVEAQLFTDGNKFSPKTNNSLDYELT
jgi:hypothetical protein